MTAWTAFASVAGVVTVLLLLLSHSTSQRFGDPPDSPRDRSESSHVRDAVAPEDEAVLASDVEEVVETDVDEAVETDVDGSAASVGGEREVRGDGDVASSGGREEALARELSGTRSLSQPMLLLNVALSQGVFAVVLVAAAVLGDVPRAALGVGDPQLSGWLALVGVALGVALYGANEAGSRFADAAGLGRNEDLRALLAPDSRVGWVVLLGGVLPIVAGFEELLFRGVLVGAFATGFDVSPWLLVVASSVLFGLGHGAQGRLGVLVTGTLGVVLGAAFVLTGSLLVVVVAHYLVNALEFVVHEGVLD